MMPDELDDELLQRLGRFVAPEPDPARIDALIEQLRPLVAERRERPVRFRAVGLYRRPVAATLGWLTAQTYLYRPAFWLASALLLALGLIAVSAAAGSGLGQALAMAAPVPAVLGVAWAFRSAEGGSGEIERTCPVSPFQLVLGRTLVILLYNVALGIPVALVAGLTARTVLLGWLAPLLFLLGLTICLTTVIGARWGLGAGMLLWGAQVLLLDRWIAFPWLRYLLLYRSPADDGWLLTQLTALALGVALLVCAHLAAGRLGRSHTALAG